MRHDSDGPARLRWLFQMAGCEGLSEGLGLEAFGDIERQIIRSIDAEKFSYRLRPQVRLIQCAGTDHHQPSRDLGFKPEGTATCLAEMRCHRATARDGEFIGCQRLAGDSDLRRLKP